MKTKKVSEFELPDGIIRFDIEMLEDDDGEKYKPGTFEYEYIEHFCNGKLLPDFAKHLEARKHFQEFNCYTKAIPNNHPQSSYMKFWEKERDRCLNGCEIDGIFISGYLYWYWNYTPIVKIKVVGRDAKTGKEIGEKVYDFPDVYDTDYFWYWYLDECEKRGLHGSNIKARRKGFSYKGSSMMTRNFYLIKNSKNYAIADSWDYLKHKDGLLVKVSQHMSFIDEFTAWFKRRGVKDTDVHRRATFKKYVNDTIIEAGYWSEIIGISLDGDIDKVRGISGKLILWEESGNNRVIERAWEVAKGAMQIGNVTHGLMISWGCVCAGTKIWTKDGNLINIEDLKQEQGIIGYNGKEYTIQNISYMQEKATKPCYRITTNSGNFVECSEDHPILIKGKQLRVKGKSVWDNKYIETKDLKVNDYVSVIDKVDIFGIETFEHPRVIGWLLGDGSYGIDQSARLYNCEPEINEYIHNNFDHKTRETYQTKLDKTYEVNRISNIIPILRKLEMYGQTKERKKLPNNIFKCTKEVISEFIGGLFDTDGYVNIRKNKTRGENSYMFELSVSQCQIELLQQLRLLLSKFGIHGNIRKRLPRKENPKDKNPYYELVIADQVSISRFVDNIKLFPKVKQERLDEIKEICKTRKSLYNLDQGLRYEKIETIEYIGEKEIYNLTAIENNNYLINNIVSHNTGGSEGADFSGLEKMMRKPEEFDILPIPYIWEYSRIRNKTAFFVPDYISKQGYSLPNGDSDMTGAIKYEVEKRNTLRNNPALLRQHIAEYPFTIEEATLSKESSIFDIRLIREQIAELAVNPIYTGNERIGRMVLKGGSASFKLDPTVRALTEFPSNDKEPEGGIIVYELPYIDSYGKVPWGMYIAGTDPVDLDKNDVGSKYSLASTIVMNRVTRRIVAEYTGRTRLVDTYYEQLRLLLMYYNAETLFEANLVGVYRYFERMNSLHYLADTPSLFQDKFAYKGIGKNKGIKSDSRGQVKAWGRELISKWSIELIEETDENGESKQRYNMHTIRSRTLLEEMRQWHKELNCDRVDAFTYAMILMEDKANIAVDRNNEHKVTISDPYWGNILGKNKQGIQRYIFDEQGNILKHIN